MDALESIGNLVERLTGKIEAIINDREEMLAEISGLRERLMERDEEAVKAAHEMRAELEAARADALRFEQERTRIEARLQVMNDRLTALVCDEKHSGG
jgi:chromosome segregation ATPase